MSSKEDVLKYCNTFKNVDLEHIGNALENAKLINKGEYRYLNGCPSSFGLDDYVGICEEDMEVDYASLNPRQQFDVCEACWKRALGVEGDHDKGRED